MNRSDFHYHLPQELVAQLPSANRSDSRLLVYDAQQAAFADARFYQLTDFLKPDDLLVFNQTKVINARLHASKPSGGRCELLVERVLSSDRFVAQVKASQSPKPGTMIRLASGHQCRCLARRDRFFEWQLLSAQLTVSALLDAYGEVPLPPYIRRHLSSADNDRYQTVYARVPGAVAAPTAGLHFDKPLLDKLSDYGVNQAWITLHVGAGTFLPVKADQIEAHDMHSEWLCVDPATVSAIQHTKAKEGRVVAVGTTVVRALETAALNGELRPFEGETNIFLYPGKRFHVIDGLITNFHLPESTLLMLVAAFIGLDEMHEVYRHAIEKRYRFFSYGDASLLWRSPQ